MKKIIATALLVSGVANAGEVRLPILARAALLTWRNEIPRIVVVTVSSK